MTQIETVVELEHLSHKLFNVLIIIIFGCFCFLVVFLLNGIFDKKENREMVTINNGRHESAILTDYTSTDRI